ncbi:hypothetical protein PBY51_017311 [Eleginops maclovinus]|uniref:Ig-like domain-containing protein n=1 Tax=Eleginops maclovinus TaxID=56733 RepID=A0AAN8AMM7_ELEMC|nr:hypothetical protein PBY51_017311 [Eleginops maclovinus]
MGTITVFLLCSFVVFQIVCTVGTAQNKVTLLPDKPFVRLHVLDKAELECCYSKSETQVEIKWYHQTTKDIQKVNPTERVTPKDIKCHANGNCCGMLILDLVRQNDTGLYQCLLTFNNEEIMSHGTYLQVYKPMEKTINMSESTKNKILTAEGILLLLCVLLPSISLLSKSKRINELKKIKVTSEEENIYQGLNLDECWSTYDQIERPQTRGQYQDVGNIKGLEEEEIQLEKP